ncbi:family 20 glycosylhydrolase [uncultured Bacteroides sp.]|uniref:family 20 glycosylhydrolase n=1 Tax=uncultured Bacteroides sp. TaxID=162156 RepID=UPI0025E82BF0|nr:family 20 glycosylhydrolase [uncultured Bacteroides sp.]
MKKQISILCILLLLGMVTNAQVNIPQVIPSLQNWKAGKGKLVLPATGKIIVAPEAESLLKETAEIVAKDLKAMFGWNYQVISGKPEKSSIYLSLKNSPTPSKEEGYEMNINNRVTIEASTVKGVFWGTRTLLQMLHNQPSGIMQGKTSDYPQYSHRGLMIDVARKFFTIDYLRDYIKILSFYKMNELQIHLNDNGFVEFFDNDWKKTYAAFRLESDCFPGLTAKDGSYTKEEFRNLQKMAARYGINIIPEIDVPAHSLAFTHYNPNLAADKKEYGMDHLDLYKKEVYNFLDTLFNEYLSGDEPVFLGPDVHIGTDEYNLKEAEQFRYFTDYYLKYVSGYGKNPRLWGSLKHMKGDTPVNLKGKTVNAWNYNWMDMETALKEGAKVVNTCDEFLYIVPSVNYYHDFLEYKWLYENWSPRMMKKGEMTEYSPNLSGAMFAVWNDRVGNGISQQDVHIRTFPAMQMIAEKLWKGENTANISFDTFENLCKRTPEAPGVNLQARVDGRNELTPNKKEIILQGNDSILTSVSEIGYPYTVEFEIRPDAKANIDAVVFKGPHSVFVANWQNTGKFAFRRDGYEFVFHAYRLPVETWTKVRIEGDKKGTSLYINGKLQERLEGRIGVSYNLKAQKKDSIWYQETLIFPLQQIGDKQMGFKGLIKNIICMQPE